MNKISIVIPVLNEETTIGKLLIHLIENSSNSNISEIFVVDGGSIDKTKKVVSNIASSGGERSQKGVNSTRPEIFLLNSSKGRAKQMNIGAKKASGNILYFLHADSFPPKDFDKHIISEIEKENLAGCFKMKFDHPHWWLRLASWLTQFRWRACRGGDQSQFITKELFEELGHF